MIPYYSEPPTFDEFLQCHLIPNKPCIIGPQLIDHWKARKEWVVPTNAPEDAPQWKPNYAYLRDHYGSAEGQVAMCNKRHFTDQERTIMPFADFVNLWEADDGRPSVYYLKDMHLQQAFPQDHFYKVPHLFQDDWLNEYWLEKGDDDYRFVYLGGDSTFTPLHADVYRSYSWSSNICGIKKWTFFPPGQEDLYKDALGNTVYDIRDYDKSQFVHFEKAHKIVVYQRDGETVFVPSGWFHQVENIGATISINHNWSNATNLMLTYQSLKKDYDDCKKAIEDLKESMSELEFIEECQKLLLVHSGWDWKTFLSIIDCVVTHRVNKRNSLENQPSLSWQFEKINQVLYEWEKDESNDLIQYLKGHKNGELYHKLESIRNKVNITM